MSRMSRPLVLQKFRQKIKDGVLSFLFARDGVEALAALKTNGGIDLVVTDINMPRMDGLLLLQKLQESERGVSTIIVSAYGDMANIRTAMNRGAFDFVTKPIDWREQYDDPTTKSYLDAFAKLKAGDPDAIAAFAAHVGKLSGDQLASFHLKRLLNGATGTRIALD
jgi:adenylate cyclase